MPLSVALLAMSGYRAADPPLLLVEDNVRDAALIQTYVRHNGNAIRWVDRLSSGLDVVRGQPIAEVLLDLNLPDSEGLQTLEKMRGAAPHVPIVVISGADDPEFVDLVLKAGASEYLVKGRFDSEVLRGVIDRHRQRPRTPDEFIVAENRFRAILSSLQEGLLAIDSNGVITYVNDQLAALLQRPAHEIMGRPATRFLDERSAAMAREYLLRRRLGYSDRYSVTFEKPDGNRIDVSVSGTPIHDANGHFQGSVATVLDVSPRDGLDDFARVIADHVSFGLFMIVDGVFRYVNPAFARMLGYLQSEIRGHDSLELVSAEDRDVFLAAERPDQQRLVRLHRKDGSIASLLLQTSRTNDDDRTSIVGTARDLTETADNIESKHLLASIVEASSDAVLACDLRGIILTWNQGAERIFGYTAEEMIGKRNVRSLVPDELAGETDAIIRRVRDSQQVQHLETRRRAKSGEEISVSLSVAPIRNRHGAIVAFSAIMRDITARKKADRLLEQQARMSSLGRMASSIAHEFNNVLMGIQPFAEVMERASSNPKVRNAAGQIRNSVRRGKAVADEILRFGNPKPPALETISVTSWMLSTIKPELQAVLGPDIDLKIDLHGEMFMLADPSQMAQVLVNLAINSRHAMPDGGAVEIRVGPYEPEECPRFARTSSPQQFIHIEFEDTGTGMNQATLDRIFEPLFTTKSKGSGLGLPMVHQIMERHAGHVFVESTPGEGTTFHLLVISADVKTTAEEVTAYGAARMSGRLRVLIVDDEVDIADGLKELFHIEGVECEVVYDAGEVVPAIERFGPDVLLLDVTLGEASGFDVYKAVAKRWPKLPVIFSTGTATATEIESLPGAHNVTLLQKPYDFARLTAEIGRVCAGRNEPA